MRYPATHPTTLSLLPLFKEIFIFQSVEMIFLALPQVTTYLLRTQVVTCGKARK
jgi:hypothetical protein